MASKRISRLVKILSGAIAGTDDIFQLDGRLDRFVHFWALVVRQFVRYRCFVRASALSFSTLLALVPLLAVALSITSRFLNPQQEAALANFVEKTVSSVAPSVVISTNSPPVAGAEISPTNTGLAVITGYTNAVATLFASNAPPATAPAPVLNTQKQVAAKIHDLVQKASNGTLSSIGLIFLVITAVSLLRGIEETFNDMWGVTRGRNWWLQFTLYWFIITGGPLLISVPLGIAGSAHMEATRRIIESSHWLAPVFNHALPIAILSLALGFFYKVTPNTKVEISAALTGGACAGIAWHCYNQLGVLLVSRALSANKYYGSLALVVLVMGGLYVLWLIILFGAQIAYAYQNRSAYLQDRLAENVNQRGREFVALRIMTSVARRFQDGLPAATVPEISAELGVPSRLTQSVLRTLRATRLVTEVAGAEAAFVPARPLNTINAHDILIAMRTGTGQELPLCDAPELAAIYGEFARIEEAERKAASSICLVTLVNRLSVTQPPPETKLVEEQKTHVPQGATVKIVEPEITESLKPVTVAEPLRTVVTPAPPPAASTPPPAPPIPELATHTPPAPEPAKREPARPNENTEFPL